MASLTARRVKLSAAGASRLLIAYEEAMEPTRAEGCDSYDLVAMSEGRLLEQELDRVWAHVDSCTRCADVVAHLGALTGPSRCGRYELQETLGAGGMGVVYAAWDPQLRRRVAVKLVRPDAEDPNAHARILREARALARISHPNVVAVHDVGEEGGQIYLATELVEGETLVTWQRGKAPRQLVEAWLQVARGLAAAHREGVVHRDIKPANCLVDREGRVRIGDFGLAREPQAPGAAPGESAAEGDAKAEASADSSVDKALAAPAHPHATEISHHVLALGSEASEASDREASAVSGSEPAVTAAGKVVGTLGYMAPEQRRGAVDPRSDQFSLCVALTEALTGQRPRAGSQVKVPALPALDAVLTRGLATRAERRYASMEELASALAAVVTPGGPLAAIPPGGGAGRAQRLALGLALLGLVVLAAIALARRPSGPPPCALALTESQWGPARRAEVEKRLPTNVAQRLTTYAERWHAAARASCAEASPVPRASAERCLREVAGALEQRLAGWLAEDDDDRTATQAELDRLRDPAHCARGSWRGAEPPAAQAALSLRLARAEQGGDERELEAVVREAQTLAAAKVAAQAGVVLAALRKARGDAGGAEAALRQAAAAATNNPDTQLELLLALITQTGERQPEAALAVAEQARAVIAGAGGDEVHSARVHQAVAAMWGLRRRWDEAAPLYERARAAYRATYGADSYAEAMCVVALAGAYRAQAPKGELARRTWDEARAMLQRLRVRAPMPSLDGDPRLLVEHLLGAVQEARQRFPGTAAECYAEYALATAYVLAEEDERALEHYRRQIELADRIDLRDAQRADGLAQAAAILLERGASAEAEPLARGAVRVAQELGAHGELAYAQQVLGWALVELGDAPAAQRALETALALQAKLDTPAQRRGFTRFLLARAVQKRAPARARELAHAAKADLASALAALDASDPLIAAQRALIAGRLARVEAFAP